MPSRKSTKTNASTSIPTVIGGCRPLKFARIRRSSSNSSPFVGDKEIGPVPRLVIAEPLRESGIWILHCDLRWQVLGVQTGFGSITEASQRAEEMYPGVRLAWIQAKVSMRQARQAEQQEWEAWQCSFCFRIPPEVPGTFVRSSDRKANICHLCIRDFYEGLEDE